MAGQNGKQKIYKLLSNTNHQKCFIIAHSEAGGVSDASLGMMNSVIPHLFYLGVTLSWCQTDISLTVGFLKNEHISYCLLPRTTFYKDRNTIRRMSQEFVMTAVMSWSAIEGLLTGPMTSTTLVSVKGIQPLVALRLEKSLRRLSPKLTWLIETSANETDLQMSIPVHWNFVLARPQGDGSYILETVYYVNKKLPPISHTHSSLEKDDTGHLTLKRISAKRTNFYGAPVVAYNPLPDPCYYRLACFHHHLVSDFEQALNFTRIDVTTEELTAKLAGKYDIVANIAAFHVMSNFQDMLGPVLKAAMYMYIRDSYGKHADYWISFLSPFENVVWVSLCGFTALSSLIIVIVQRFSGGSDIISAAFTPLDAISYQGVSYAPRTWSVRWSMFMPRILVGVLYPAYGAAIIAFLTVKITTWPFIDIIGFRKDGTYKLGGLKLDTFSRNYFKLSGNTDMQEIATRQQIQESELLLTYEENIRKICNDPNFAFLSYNSLLEKFSAPCSILRIPTPVAFTFTGLAFYPDSPLKPYFKITLLNMYSSGLLSHENPKRPKTEPEKDAINPIEQIDITMPMVLLLTGTVLSVVIMNLELLYYNQRLKQAKKNRVRNIICTQKT